jgi:hypothetical protein
MELVAASQLYVTQRPSTLAQAVTIPTYDRSNLGGVWDTLLRYIYRRISAVRRRIVG